MKKYFGFIICFFICTTIVASAQHDSGTITIVFTNMAGNESIERGKTYYNAFHEPFTIDRLKYYVSNIRLLKDEQPAKVATGEHYLINQDDPASCSLTIKAPPGIYTAISFLLGVDSIKNVSGTQTDALDPMNGMFWTWNSGYIMAKFEGTSPLSTAPNQLIEYHIGGFSGSQNTTRNVKLPFPSGIAIASNTSEGTTIKIKADINGWFRGAHDLKIADQQACTTPGSAAVRYADNYAHMFSVDGTGK